MGCPEAHLSHSQPCYGKCPRKLWKPSVRQILGQKDKQYHGNKNSQGKTCGGLNKALDSLAVLPSRGGFLFFLSMNLDWTVTTLTDGLWERG